MAKITLTITTTNPDARAITRETVEHLNSRLSQDETGFHDVNIVAADTNGPFVTAHTWAAEWNYWLETVNTDPAPCP